ncbi:MULTISPECIES: TetR family transcriptional regulator [unclassified Corynebacterium]|uniref:TetR family transcriptional regulator n=1 Tax=unclassified Corynebacterium TaxID=2624378 RepID=UPI001D0DDB05|nr:MULTISPECIES: TetR family transcriptional regulator [unclassified Corynebacterium]
MVLIADEVCARTDSRVRSYPALAACAATTSARLRGVPLHHHVTQMAATVQDHIRALRPLTQDNDVFSHVVADILHDLNA